MHHLRRRTTLLLALGLTLATIGAFAQESVPVDVSAEAAGQAATGALPLLSRWLHVLGAIFLLGSAFYARAILMPAATTALDDESHQKLRAGLRSQWSKFLHVLILILFATGLYNFLAVTRFAHDGQPTYHMLFGIKFILAIAVFGLASMLAGRKSVSTKLQQNMGLWLGVTIAMGVAIVLIAGYMKMM